MFGKFFLRVFVGILVATLVSGGKALGLIAIAVICTGGLGLLGVIPAAYLLGLLCTIWWIPFGSSTSNEPAMVRTATAEPRMQSIPEHGALADYIMAAEAKGQSWVTIQADLLQAGWPVETVTNALTSARISARNNANRHPARDS